MGKTSVLVVLLNIFFLTKCNLRQLKDIPKYDSYLFAIQWNNDICDINDEFCVTKQALIPKNSFSIHGFWPASRTGVEIGDCSIDHIQVKETELTNLKELSKYWVNLYSTDTDVGFWSHEYTKHGYCYVVKNKLKGYADYFEKVIDLFYYYGLPTLFQRAFPGQTSPLTFESFTLFQNSLKKAFPGQYYKIKCKKKLDVQYIEELWISYGLNYAPTTYLFKGSCTSKMKTIITFK